MINNNELIDQIKSYNRFLNSESLNKAYNFALEAHQNQKEMKDSVYNSSFSCCKNFNRIKIR